MTFSKGFQYQSNGVICTVTNYINPRLLRFTTNDGRIGMVGTVPLERYLTANPKAIITSE